MSLLTVKLLGRPAPSQRRINRWTEILGLAADRLVAAYGTPTLGNFADPVKEVFYIVLSARTTDAQYRKTHLALTSKFPSLSELAQAEAEQIVPCISGGGLANKRASQIKRTAAALLDRLGSDPSKALVEMTTEEAYQFLVNLPGMGPKSALCVMMCSLNADVFPVDVNVQRIAARLGTIRSGLKHYQAQNLLPGLVPPGRSKDLHVGMVVLGRQICLPRRPKCDSCTLRDLCQTGRKHKLAAK